MNKVKFGYKEISDKDKPEKVNQIFSSVSDKYDLMNDIMSFGLHRLWKKKFIKLCNLNNKKDVLDIACGTGDIALNIKKYNPKIKLTCLDPNKEMLEICKSKFINNGFTDIIYLLNGAEDFTSKNNHYDLITTVFGFRNFSNHKKALCNIFDKLKPGGSFLLMDFKKPTNKIYSKLFKFYTINVIPKIGEVVANDKQSYDYLGESIQTYYTPEEIGKMFIDAGFENYKIINFSEDIATIHMAHKS